MRRKSYQLGTDEFGKIHTGTRAVCELPSRPISVAGGRFRHPCFDSDGVRIHYIEQGTGKAVVLIHGTFGCALPSVLRSLVWHHKKKFYGYLLQCARSTLSSFAQNDKNLGAEIGMTMVLHAHTRRLDYHPHVHVIVPGVCINKWRKQCIKLRGKYLFGADNPKPPVINDLRILPTPVSNLRREPS